jgi:hypothetical protein
MQEFDLEQEIQTFISRTAFVTDWFDLIFGA